MASDSKESPSNNPGLHATPDEATKGYFLQQTMFRIKDPKVSLGFYSKVLGMSLLKRLDFPKMKFSLYFMGYEDTSSAPRKILNYRNIYQLDNKPRGFGHIGVTVDDAYKACERFESLGVEFVKKPLDGKMKGVAFIKDPDGYWIEIFDIRHIKEAAGSAS
ncbi:unnamed protein product [Withania somnifera]